MSVQCVELHCPSLQDVAEVLEKGLQANFAEVSVTVVECPDLTQDPFTLADKGLCGGACLADVGGVPNLIPLVNKDKIYNIPAVAAECNVPTGFVIGAGAGPAHHEGVNAEMIANFRLRRGNQEAENGTRLCKVNPQDGSYTLKMSGSPDFCLLGNLFISEGKQGQVLDVRASRRTGTENLVTCLQKTLASHYGNQAVGLGGTFAMTAGKAKIHVMPDFSECPLNTDEDVDKWLHFYEMSAPLVAVGYVVSHDPDLDLRLEHFHCFSNHGDGGHYHYDTTPDDVRYHGYFNLGQHMYRIDRPKQTHNVGRD